MQGEGCSTSVQMPGRCCSPWVRSRGISQPPAAVCDCEAGEEFETISLLLDCVVLSCVSWRWQNLTTDLWSCFGLFFFLFFFVVEK